MQETSPPKPRRERHQRKKDVAENFVEVRPPLLNLEYP
jgi:hypothetical protein